MCRLFGFRSVIASQVHRSLVAADNALAVQSAQHPDGWGVAYYVEGAPHITKSADTALNDNLFRRVSGIVSSETVVAHIRKATVGTNSVLNSHPFQYGRWVMAHNGDIANFDEKRDAIEAEIAPRLRRFILGDTDSERIFFLFLSELQRYGPLNGRIGIEAVMAALKTCTRRLREICDAPDTSNPALLNILVTNGTTLVATQGGKDLYWSTYKARCGDSQSCPHYAFECENPSKTGFVNHLVISSEPLSGENIWVEMQPGDFVGVDWRMQVVQDRL